MDLEGKEKLWEKCIAKLLKAPHTTFDSCDRTFMIVILWVWLESQ